MKQLFAILVIACISYTAISQEVKLNTNLVVESDGTVRMENEAMVWDDLRVTLDKGSSAASLEYFSGSTGPQIWYFRHDASIEAMSFTVQLPHSWKQGTTIYPHLHWTPETTASGAVEWNFDYTWASYNSGAPEVFPAITTSTVTANGPFIANTHLITPLTAANAGLSAEGKTISSILICRIWRNGTVANDTYNADAGLLFLDFHYQLDTFGSRLEYSK